MTLPLEKDMEGIIDELLEPHLIKEVTLRRGNRVFQCNLCSKDFSQSSLFERHLRSHTGERPFKCDVCDKSFKQMAHLKDHNSVHKVDRPFSCEFCPKLFRLKKSLKQHSKLCDIAPDFPIMQDEGNVPDTENKFTCCNKVFTSKRDLKSHFSSHIITYDCKWCQRTFGSNRKLVIHSKVHSNLHKEDIFQRKNGVFCCDLCNKTFTQREYLKRHFIRHTGERAFECDECGKRFTQFGHLKEHTITHTDNKPFSCDFCSTQFKSKIYLKRHNKLCDKNPDSFTKPGMVIFQDITTENSRACSVCNIAFATNNDLNKHHRSHNTYECKNCSGTFVSMRALLKHSKEHKTNQVKTEEETNKVETMASTKRFYCQQCGKSFDRKDYYERHLRTHNNERPFQCTQCGKGFRQPAHLKGHLLVHSRYKAFQCTICNKNFNTLTRTKQHIETHKHKKVQKYKVSTDMDVCKPKHTNKKEPLEHSEIMIMRELFKEEIKYLVPGGLRY